MLTLSEWLTEIFMSFIESHNAYLISFSSLRTTNIQHSVHDFPFFTLCSKCKRTSNQTLVTNPPAVIELNKCVFIKAWSCVDMSRLSNGNTGANGEFRIFQNHEKTNEINSVQFHLLLNPYRSPFPVFTKAETLKSLIEFCFVTYEIVSFFSSQQVWNSNRLTTITLILLIPSCQFQHFLFPLSLSNSFHSLAA